MKNIYDFRTPTWNDPKGDEQDILLRDGKRILVEAETPDKALGRLKQYLNNFERDWKPNRIDHNDIHDIPSIIINKLPKKREMQPKLSYKIPKQRDLNKRSRM